MILGTLTAFFFLSFPIDLKTFSSHIERKCVFIYDDYGLYAVCKDDIYITVDKSQTSTYYTFFIPLLLFTLLILKLMMR
jgi:hypothetical protein